MCARILTPFGLYAHLWFALWLTTIIFAAVAIDQFQRPVQHIDGTREGQHFASVPLFPRTIIRPNFRFAEDAVSEPRREDDANLERLGSNMLPHEPWLLQHDPTGGIFEQHMAMVVHIVHMA